LDCGKTVQAKFSINASVKDEIIYF